VVRLFGVPPRIIVEADNGPALHIVGHMAHELHLKKVAISKGSSDLFDAAVTLGSAAITPLIDRAAALLRKAGIRDIEAARLASSLFEQTARDYAHSGKQSWAWYVRRPVVQQLKAQIAAVGPHLEPVFRHLVLFGFETFHKHRDVDTEMTLSRGEG
jgi:hypothetical protein